MRVDTAAGLLAEKSFCLVIINSLSFHWFGKCHFPFPGGNARSARRMSTTRWWHGNCLTFLAADTDFPLHFFRPQQQARGRRKGDFYFSCCIKTGRSNPRKRRIPVHLLTFCWTRIQPKKERWLAFFPRNIKGGKSGENIIGPHSYLAAATVVVELATTWLTYYFPYQKDFFFSSAHLVATTPYTWKYLIATSWNRCFW